MAKAFSREDRGDDDSPVPAAMARCERTAIVRAAQAAPKWSTHRCPLADAEPLSKAPAERRKATTRSRL